MKKIVVFILGLMLLFSSLVFAEEQLFEAEFIEEQHKTQMGSEHSGFTGLGYMDFYPNEPGGYVEWPAQISSSGEYVLEFRYANGASDRPAEIKVNDEVVEEELSFPGTGVWDNWETTSTRVDLEEGEHVFRITGVADPGGANIDHIKLYPVEEAEGEDIADKTISVDEVEVDEIIPKQIQISLEKDGYISDSALPASDSIHYVEFLNMINKTFGFEDEADFVDVDSDTNNYGVSNLNWYSYVFEVAEENGYLDRYVTLIDPEEAGASEVTEKEAADILGSVAEVLELEYDELSDMDDEDKITTDQARELVNGLADKADVGETEVGIVEAKALDKDLVMVVLDSEFKDLDLNDLAVSLPQNTWGEFETEMAPLAVDKGAVTENMLGNTVVFYELEEQLNDDASYEDYKEQINPEDPYFAENTEVVGDYAHNIMSWQMDHGGWGSGKMGEAFQKEWDGEEERSDTTSIDGDPVGSLDSGGTTGPIRFLAKVYKEAPSLEMKESIENGIDFLVEMQYNSGGFPQVYPERGEKGERERYSNFVTYNDNAMMTVMNLLDDILSEEYPFDNSFLISSEYEDKVQEAFDKGIEYILDSQIVVDGERTAWGGQHDPETYEPRYARTFEPPAISTRESVEIVKLLMEQPDKTPEVKRAIAGALNWLEENKLEDTKYVRFDDEQQFFHEAPGEVTWYRFYEIGTNKPVFAGRNSIPRHDLSEIEEERQEGYGWAGNYASQLLNIAKSTGYYARGKVFIEVIDDNSIAADNKVLKIGEIEPIEPINK